MQPLTNSSPPHHGITEWSGRWPLANKSGGISTTGGAISEVSSRSSPRLEDDEGLDELLEEDEAAISTVVNSRFGATPRGLLMGDWCIVDTEESLPVDVSKSLSFEDEDMLIIIQRPPKPTDFDWPMPTAIKSDQGQQKRYRKQVCSKRSPTASFVLLCRPSQKNHDKTAFFILGNNPSGLLLFCFPD